MNAANLIEILLTLPPPFILLLFVPLSLPLLTLTLLSLLLFLFSTSLFPLPKVPHSYSYFSISNFLFLNSSSAVSHCGFAVFFSISSVESAAVKEVRMISH